MPTSTRQNAPFFTEVLGEFVDSQWGDVGIAPYEHLGGAQNVKEAESPEIRQYSQTKGAPMGRSFPFI